MDLALELLKIAQETCQCCEAKGKDKKAFTGNRSTILYIAPYDLDITVSDGWIIREVACNSGSSTACSVFINAAIMNFEKVVCTPEYASKILRRHVESFETFTYRGKKIIAVNACNFLDKRVRQEIGE